MPQQIEVELLAKGHYQPTDIRLNVSHEPLFSYEKDLQRKIDELWHKQLADAQKKGYKLWNSETYALKKVEERAGRLTLDLGLVEYRNQVGIVQLFEEGEIGPERCSPLMYCSVILRTKDGQYLFGIGQGFTHDGALKFVGGSYSKDEIELVDGESLFQLAFDEIKEEINVERGQINHIELVRIYRTHRGMIDLTFWVQLSVSSAEVKTLFAKLKEKEFAKLLVFPPAEAKVAVGALGGQRAKKIDLIK